VVIATRNRPRSLVASVRAVLDAATAFDGAVEVVVADDSDVDETAHAALAAAGIADAVRIVRTGGGTGPAHARNLGVAAASGDLLAFTDDDTVCAVSWLSRAVTRFEYDAGLAGLEGVVRPRPDGATRPVRARIVSNTRGGAYLTANLFLRRSAFARAGGFRTFGQGDWPYPYREDTDLALRVVEAGGTIAFDPDLVVWHPIESLALRAYLRTGKFFVIDAAFKRAHPSAIPSPIAAPFARLRIRLAVTAVAATPLLLVPSLRRPAGALITSAVSLVSLQVDADLARAGVSRQPAQVALDAIRRLPRAAAWSYVAGGARITGELMVARAGRRGSRRLPGARANA
jgi:glycosyltransferase involved in cell wall biosynthesis